MNGPGPASGPAWLTSDARGLPFADPRVERVARVVALLASVWMALAACWEIAGPIGAGHFAVVGARGMIAENFWTWHIWGPVRTYTIDEPSPGLYYLHHPLGMFWLIGVLHGVLGRHEWVIRLAPVAMSVATPVLLYGIGRRLWGPIAGAVSAAAFTVLPIALGYANFPGFEIPVVFGCLLTTWGYLRFAEGWRRRWMVVSLLGIAWTANSDWEAYLFLGLVLGVLLLAALFAPRRWYAPVDLRRFVQWWALGVGVMGMTLAMYVYLFQRAGQLDEMLMQGRHRSAGSELPLAEVLLARRYWIEIMFTPLAILLGKLAAPVLVLRFVVLRKLHEIFPLALLGMCLVHYVLFKNGADVHIYWSYPFAGYFGLAMGALTEAVLGSVSWLWQLALRRPAPRAFSYATLGVLLLPLLAILPDGVRGLKFSHMTGGRFNDDGHLNLQDVDKAAAVKWMVARMEPGTVVGMHLSIKPNWGLEWNLHRPVEAAGRARNDAVRRYFIADARFMTSADLTSFAADQHVHAVGPFLFVDGQVPKAPLDGYAFDEREPKLWEWYLLQGNDPMRSVRPDPFVTWELRDALGQTPNDPPGESPVTLEQRRIAHNLAVARGDHALAERYYGELLAGFDRGVSMPYTDGTQLLGRRYVTGVAPRLQLLFESSADKYDEIQFDVRSMLDADARFSLVERDDKEKQVGTYFTLPPRLWKKGRLYLYECEIRHRPGTERFYGYWFGRGTLPAPSGAADRATLLTLK